MFAVVPFLLTSVPQRVRCLETSRILGLLVIWCALTGPRCSVIQSMIGDLTDATNEARAIPLTSIMWNIGSIVGPMLGGILSSPHGNIQTRSSRGYSYFKITRMFLVVS